MYPLQFIFISPKIIKTLEGLMHRMIWERDPRFSKLDTQTDPDLDPLTQIGSFQGRRWIRKVQATNKITAGGINAPHPSPN